MVDVLFLTASSKRSLGIPLPNSLGGQMMIRAYKDCSQKSAPNTLGAIHITSPEPRKNLIRISLLYTLKENYPISIVSLQTKTSTNGIPWMSKHLHSGILAMNTLSCAQNTLTSQSQIIQSRLCHLSNCSFRITELHI